MENELRPGRPEPTRRVITNEPQAIEWGEIVEVTISDAADKSQGGTYWFQAQPYERSHRYSQYVQVDENGEPVEDGIVFVHKKRKAISAHNFCEPDAIMSKGKKLTILASAVAATGTAAVLYVYKKHKAGK